MIVDLWGSSLVKMQGILRRGIPSSLHLDVAKQRKGIAMERPKTRDPGHWFGVADSIRSTACPQTLELLLCRASTRLKPGGYY